MTLGPGKYDAEVVRLQKNYQAHGVILIMIGGVMGQGFSVVATPEVTANLPDMLRHMADQIETDMAGMTNG